MRVGLGVVTHKRPRPFNRLMDTVYMHLSDQIDFLCAYQDGEDKCYIGNAYYGTEGGYIHTTDNLGVGVAKNALLTEMMDAGCDWLFISEDDLLITSPLAISGYIDACRESGYHHLMFHAHGAGNTGDPLRSNGPVTEWPAYVGAWCVYSRECIEECGLMDEGFYLAWEHVEHSVRIGLRGMTSPWQGAADATNSEQWIIEQDVPSVIRPRQDWQDNILIGREYWQETHPDTYRLVFG